MMIGRALIRLLLPAMLAAAVFLLLPAAMAAQVTGAPRGNPAELPEEPPGVPADTLFLFAAARPLIDSTSVLTQPRNIYGVDLLFSNSGFGAGVFYQHNYSQALAGFVNLGVTGSRDRDEFEQYDYQLQDWRVPGKVNRLYTLPLTVGIRYRVFDEVLVDNFRPYFNAGAGPSLIVALPYDYEFFSSFSHARAYATFGGFVGAGAEVGSGHPTLGVNVRYFFIPIHPGLESLRNDPITDFGGLFLTMNIGFN
ncbi:MAG TPA: hypothetical protein VHI13_10030 [Candidatus Kapabacteria bacterium]|nr:hypothetical protein [Candidatus Kapabacteria bacterium]